jgi:hypothetical protein
MNLSTDLEQRALKKIILLIPLLVFGLRLQSQPDEQSKRLEIQFLPGERAFTDSASVEISAPEATAVFYTLDGKIPNRQATPYIQPIRLEKTTVIRAIAYYPTDTTVSLAKTYFIGEPATNLPVISLAVPPSLLFDPEKGLFMTGKKADEDIWNKPGANFWSREEAPIHTEIFESDGECVFRSPTGLRLFGGMSRLFPQKSVAIVADETYGEKKIKHPLFGKKQLKSFKFLTLRNSGSDFGKTHFRDAFMTGLLDECDIDKQAYRPAHVYINGLYWGIYNMREKVNTHFISDHHDVDRDSIDLIEHFLVLRQGSSGTYRQMLDFMETHELSDPVNFAYVERLMEVDNFINYQVAQIYFDNQDAGGNIKYWRPQTENGRWRWILFDTDWGFGLHDDQAFQNNSLAFHTEPNGPKWPNPPWSTFLLRKLLENPGFERAFVNSFADHLNTTFDPVRVSEHIDRCYEQLLPEMPRHLARWRLNRDDWEEAVQMLHTFGRERPQYVRMHLMERFNTGAMREIKASASQGGRIVVNRQVKVAQDTFQGIYFENYPLDLQAKANFGYRFSHWEGALNGNDPRKKLSLKEKTTLVRAVFVPYHHPLAGRIMINEISANNKSSKDWVEILNYSDEKVNLKNWAFTDAKHEFFLPDITLGPNDYLILCENKKKFERDFPDAYNVIGDLDFGINKSRETLALYSESGAMIDSLSYDVPPTDSVFTFSLLLPQLDNADLDNWRQAPGPGTPNAPNPYFIESRIRYQQGQWGQLGLAASVLLIGLFLLILRWRRVI